MGLADMSRELLWTAFRTFIPVMAAAALLAHAIH